MIELDPYLALKTQERLSNPQNTVQNSSKISIVKVSLGNGRS